MNVDDRLGNQDVDAAALFAAARSFRPSGRGRRRVLRALGLPVGLSLFGSSLAHAAYLLSSSLKGWAIVAGVAATVGAAGSVAYRVTAPSPAKQAVAKQRSSGRYVAAAAPPALPQANIVSPAGALPPLDQPLPSPVPKPVASPVDRHPKVVAKPRRPESSIAAAPAAVDVLRPAEAPSEERLAPEPAVSPRPSTSIAVVALTPPPFRASFEGAAPVSLAAVGAGRPASLPATSSVTTSAASPLKGELALVAEAQARLRAADAPGTFAALERHTRLYPGGALAEEVELLRVRAFIARGDGGSARQTAETFLRRHPSSPLGSRFRSLLTSLDAPAVP